jgi:hypothetical protein
MYSKRKAIGISENYLERHAYGMGRPIKIHMVKNEYIIEKVLEISKS